MNKFDIVSHVANRVSLSRAEANKAVSAVFGAIQDPLSRGEPVAVTGFGTFSTKNPAGTDGANPPDG